MELTKSNYESTNPVFTNICYDFLNGENREENKHFVPVKKFVFFVNCKILVKNLVLTGFIDW